MKPRGPQGSKVRLLKPEAKRTDEAEAEGATEEVNVEWAQLLP